MGSGHPTPTAPPDAAAGRDDRREPRRAVARWGEREALVSRHQGLRYTYAELGEAVDRVARALLARRARAGRPARDLEPELRRVGARPVRDGEGRGRARQHQPGLPHVGARVRAAPVGLPRAGRRARRSRPRTTPRWSRRSAATLPELERVVFLDTADWDALAAGTDASPSSCRTASSTTRSTSSTRAAPPASPRAPRSATTTSSTTATSWRRAAATPRPTGSASPCPSTTASAWSWATSAAPRTAPAW